MRGSGEMTAAIRPTALRACLLEQLPVRRCRAYAVGLLHAECALSLGDHGRGRRAQGAGRLSACVDRDDFSETVTARPLLIRISKSCASGSMLSPPRADHRRYGPLTAIRLAESIGAATGSDALAFFDAIAPIVLATASTWRFAGMAFALGQGRCPTATARITSLPDEKEQYLAFHRGLLDGEKPSSGVGEGHSYFEGCMPIEVAADAEVDTLRSGPRSRWGSTIRRPDAGPTPWSSSDRTTGSAPCGTWSDSRPS